MPASTDKLHSLCMKLEQGAEELATELAHLGTDEGAVKAVTQCAGLFRQIASALAKGGTQDEPAPEEQPAPAQGGDRMGQALDEHMAARRP